MPNWCMNNITVSHKNLGMMQRFVHAYNTSGLMNEFLPIPEGYSDNGAWYDWCISNWGTKWDVGREEYEDHIAVKKVTMKSGSFYEVSLSPPTAWAPPIEFYNHLVDLGYNVHASYFEPGMAFCGIYHNGHDNYVEYTDKDMIPVAIWNEYNLDEFFCDDEEVEA